MNTRKKLKVEQQEKEDRRGWSNNKIRTTRSTRRQRRNYSHNTIKQALPKNSKITKKHTHEQQWWQRQQQKKLKTSNFELSASRWWRTGRKQKLISKTMLNMSNHNNKGALPKEKQALKTLLHKCLPIFNNKATKTQKDEHRSRHSYAVVLWANPHLCFLSFSFRNKNNKNNNHNKEAKRTDLSHQYSSVTLCGGAPPNLSFSLLLF